MPRFTAPEILSVTKIKKRAARSRRKKDCYGDYIDEKPAPVPAKDEWQITLKAPHSELTDWYSFLVIAMRLMVWTDPFGGVVKKMEQAERIQKGLTVFHAPEVTYPDVARSLSTVPRPLLQLFFNAFHLGKRFVPDRAVFENLEDWPVVSKPKRVGQKNKLKRKNQKWK